MAVSKRSSARRSVRRKLVWARQANAGAAIAAGAGETFNADPLTPFRTQLGARLPGITVVRTRIQWTIVDVGGQSRFVIMGLRPYNQAADGTPSVTDEDGPADDPHADWMAFDSMMLQVAGENAGVPQRDIDVKSMRRLDELSQSLMLSFQAVDALAAQVRYQISVLVALP